jgi:ATP-dependent protease HslVU (ClpYQ) ATPase subunit
VMTTLLEDTLFELPDGNGAGDGKHGGRTITMDGNAVQERLKAIVDDEDLRRYIL